MVTKDSLLNKEETGSSVADSRLMVSEWMGQQGANAVNGGEVIAALTRA